MYCRGYSRQNAFFDIHFTQRYLILLNFLTFRAYEVTLHLFSWLNLLDQISLAVSC
jgi:hypothetical protein